MKQTTFLFLLLFMFLVSTNLSAQQNWQQKIDAEVWADASVNKNFEFFVLLKDQANTAAAKQLTSKEEKGQYVFSVLQQKAAETQGDIVQLLTSQQVVFRPYFIVNGIWVNGNAALMEQLAKMEEVARIIPNPRIKNKLPQDETVVQNRTMMQVEWGILMIRADKLWAHNIKGAGVVIGGQDTGYDWVHPAINSQYRGEVNNHNYHWHDAIHSTISGSSNSCGYDSKVPCDDGDHGTHTMGTMVGDDGQGNQVGVAPEAEWIGCRNMDNGWGTPATYIECFEWFLAPTDTNDVNPDPLKAPHVIANSWGCPPSEGCNPSNFAVMQQAIINLRNAGVFIEVSAGNSGPDCESVESPAAIYEESFTVGASNWQDGLVGFSSRGFVTVDSSNRLKPNVCAPGQWIRSAVTGGNYGTKSGTSMAGPHVAGAVALLIAAQPALAGNVDSLETILEMTCDSIYATDTCGNTIPTVFPNNMVGYGRINLEKALKVIRPDLFSTSITNLNDNLLRVYPNPSTQAVTVELNKPMGMTQIRITNVLGQSVWQLSTVVDTKTIVPVASLPKGIYWISLDNGHHMITTKISKQ